MTSKSHNQKTEEFNIFIGNSLSEFFRVQTPFSKSFLEYLISVENSEDFGVKGLYDQDVNKEKINEHIDKTIDDVIKHLNDEGPKKILKSQVSKINAIYTTLRANQDWVKDELRHAINTIIDNIGIKATKPYLTPKQLFFPLAKSLDAGILLGDVNLSGKFKKSFSENNYLLKYNAAEEKRRKSTLHQINENVRKERETNANYFYDQDYTQFVSLLSSSEESESEQKSSEGESEQKSNISKDDMPPLRRKRQTRSKDNARTATQPPQAEQTGQTGDAQIESSDSHDGQHDSEKGLAQDSVLTQKGSLNNEVVEKETTTVTETEKETETESDVKELGQTSSSSGQALPSRTTPNESLSSSSAALAPMELTSQSEEKDTEEVDLVVEEGEVDESDVVLEGKYSDSDEESKSCPEGFARADNQRGAGRLSNAVEESDASGGAGRPVVVDHSDLDVDEEGDECHVNAGAGGNTNDIGSMHRIDMLIAGKQVVEQSDNDKLINEMLTNSFNYVADNGWLGNDTCVYVNNWRQDHQIRNKAPLFAPRTWQPHHGLHPLNELYADSLSKETLDKYLSKALNRKTRKKKALKSFLSADKPSVDVLYGDLNNDPSPSNLPYKKPSFMKFCHDNSFIPQPSFDPAGFEQKRVMKRKYFDTWRYPWLDTSRSFKKKNMGNDNALHLRKRKRIPKIQQYIYNTHLDVFY